jgi:hypothetical protein
MTDIIFRDLTGVATVERQLDLHFRDRLLEDEIEELPPLIDDTSRALFGITQRDTFYLTLPEPVRGKYSRREWEKNFDVLCRYTRDPNVPWRAFNLDLRCERGGRLHCFEVFGRQLVCALQRLHPSAALAFADSKASRAA